MTERGEQALAQAVAPRSVSAPDDRPEPADRADGLWLEPFDGDTAAERDQLWHTDWRHGEDW